jgi:hypothetical protein
MAVSRRRCTLFLKYWRRRTALNLTNAEVNGIVVRKTKAPASGATLEKRNGTQSATKHSEKKERFSRPDPTRKQTFLHLLDKAEALEDHGDYGNAEARYNQLIHFCKHKFGAHRYETAIPFNQLALLHRHRGRLELATTFFEKALKILIQTQGGNHDHTRTVQANLDDLCCDKARAPSAVK